MATFSSLIDLVTSRASAHGDVTAYAFLGDGESESHVLTYAALEARARSVAVRLSERVEVGGRAVLLYPPGLEFVVAFLACQLAGVVAVPVLPPRRSEEWPRFAAICIDSGAAAICTVEMVAPMLAVGASSTPALASVAVVITDTVDVQDGKVWRRPEVGPDALAFLQYTSGSTGVPKGVMVSAANLLHNESLIQRGFGLSADDVVVSWLPQYHDMGLIGTILQPLYLGARCVLLSPLDFLQQPLRWLRAISKYRGTGSGAPNFAYALCASRATDEDIASLDLSSWRVAFNGAEPVRLSTLERFAERFAPCGFNREAFLPCYGLAEGTLYVVSARGAFPRAVLVDGAKLERHAMVEVEAGVAGSRALVGCGKPTGQTVRIVDPSTLTAALEGDIGEIWVAGESVAQGYWNRPEATREAFHATIAGEAADIRFLRTGDLGVLHDGELFVTGRLKELVIVDGRNHYPHDIEETVQRDRPALRAGCGAAFAIEADGAERLVVVQEVLKPEDVDLARLAVEVRAAVAQAHGVAIHLLAFVGGRVVEKTSSGKIRRRVIRDRLLEGSLPILHRSAMAPSVSPAPMPAMPAPGPGDGPAQSGAPPSTRAPASVTALERQIAALLGPRIGLGTDAVDCEVSFAAYGLDSRALVSLSGELETALGRRLEPQIFYNHSTVRALATFLAGHDAKAAHARPGHARDARGPRPALAIVGMACRFPGAPDLASFWELLTSGRDAITEVPAARWDLAHWFDPDPSTPGKMATRWGGFLEDVDAFDGEVFGTSPREAEAMDPQQRLMLQLAWHALEDAGITADAVRGTRTGVFVGVSGSDYARLQAGTTGLLAAHAGTGNALSIVANRLSYFFDLRGPSLAIDTACSSALAALHEAAVNLAAGECDQALVGGINLLLAPDVTVAFSQNRMMAADGRCKSFNKDADGYVRSEGGGVVVVKRLEDAVAAGDRVWAVIAGSACNQDGRSNGLTAPNGGAQEAVIRDALRQAGWNARDVQFVETHGTGTRLGDPIEAEALGAVYGEGRDAASPLVLGAVKSQIGHLEAAAGMAGVIKTALCLTHGMIPANLHAAEPNPLVHLDAWRLTLPVGLAAWPVASKRRGGVSAFGFGGTNAHVLLEAAPLTRAAEAQERRPLLVLPLSAKTDVSLGALAGSYIRAFGDAPGGADPDAAGLCHVAATRRHHFREARRAVVGTTAAELARALAHRRDEGARDDERGERRPRKRGVAFLFTGQGSQHVDMGRGIYETEPVFRDAFDACDRMLAGTRQVGLRELVYPAPGEASAMGARLTETDYTQPALFAVEYALARLWLSWGIEPEVMLGHSLGEIVAATIAGVFSLEDGLKLVEARGRLMKGVPEAGGMLAVFAHERDLEELLEQLAAHSHAKANVSVAAYNGPGQLVLSGSLPELDKARVFLKHHGIDAKPLNVSHAFHSALMEPMLPAFREAARTIRYHTPQFPIISNLTGALETTCLASSDYWVEHVRAPVRFAHGVKVLEGLDVGVLLEIGPRPVLTAMARRMVDGSVYSFHASLDAGKDDARTLAGALASIYEAGVNVDWRARDARHEAQAPAMRAPLYPFETKRYWFTEEARTPAPGAAGGPGGHPLLGRALASPRIRAGEHHFASEVHLPGPAFFRMPIEPAERRVSLLAFLEIALEAQRELLPGAPRAVRDLALAGSLQVPRGEARAIQTLCEPTHEGDPRDGVSRYGMAVWTQNGDGTWRAVAHATFARDAAADVAPEPLASLRQRIRKPLDVDAWYETTRESGLQYCASPHPAIRQMWWAPSEVLAETTPREEDDVVSRDIWLKHSMWNVCNQVMGALCPRDGRGTYFPVSLEAVRFVAQPGRALVLHGRLRARVGDVPGWVVDVTAYSEEGVPVAVVEGVVMIPDEAVRTPRTEWRSAPPGARAELLGAAVRHVVARALKRQEPDLPRTAPLVTLGLDSLTAVEIATRLEQLFEVGINIAALQQGASVEDAASMLGDRLAEAEGWKRRAAASDSPLVDLNRGDASVTSLFLVHPIGGAVFCYQELARHLGSQPLVGIQSPALTGATVKFETLEQLAAHYVAHARVRQPHGPYRLGGWSMGGVLAFEMARQLEAAGEEVESLILLDALAPGGTTERPTRSAALTLLAQSLGVNVGSLALDGDIEAALEDVVGLGRAHVPALRTLSRADLRRMLAELEENLRLLADYAGFAHKGSATVLRAETPLSASRPDASGRDWSHWLTAIDALHTVPGDHFSLLSGSHVILTSSYFRKALNALAARDVSTLGSGRAAEAAREPSSVVITRPVQGRDGTLRAQLVVDESHPYFFDHPLDHVSGILMLEGLLQLLEGSDVVRGGFLRQMRATFPRFCEKDPPVQLELLRAAAGRLCTARAVQAGLPVCSLRFEASTMPLEAGDGPARRTSSAPRVARADAPLLHKARPENVLIAPWTMDGRIARTALLAPPRGHQLDAGDPRHHPPLYVFEAARQLVTALSHGLYGVPLGMPMNLVAVELVLEAPLRRGIPLVLSHALQPLPALATNTFAHFEVEIACASAPDEVLGQCRITAQLLTREAYSRLRAKDPRANAA